MKTEEKKKTASAKKLVFIYIYILSMMNNK